MTNSYTPRQLSEMALANIEANPQTWDQARWHCGTSHCWAGHIDLILGMPEWGVEQRSLHNPVQKVLGLSDYAWNRITRCSNSLADLKEYHRLYFVSREYDEDGFDCDGFDEDGVGYDEYDEDE